MTCETLDLLSRLATIFKNVTRRSSDLDSLVTEISDVTSVTYEIICGEGSGKDISELLRNVYRFQPTNGLKHTVPGVLTLAIQHIHLSSLRTELPLKWREDIDIQRFRLALAHADQALRNYEKTC